MIKIILADDHIIFLQGIASLMGIVDDIEIVGLAENGKEVLDLLTSKEVDIVVSDFSMPVMNGLEVTKIIKNRFPKVKVLILTMHNHLRIIKGIIEAGADGYILKNKGQEELINAIRVIFNGGNHFGEDVTRALINSTRSNQVEGEIHLTKREKEVLKLIALGDSSKIISEKLMIATTTVNTHRKNLVEKVGVRNSKELIRFAIEKGYV
ncbi:MAG: response regulator transcription factor [Bacteroidota bacterium]